MRSGRLNMILMLIVLAVFAFQVGLALYLYFNISPKGGGSNNVGHRIEICTRTSW